MPHTCVVSAEYVKLQQPSGDRRSRAQATHHWGATGGAGLLDVWE